MLPKLLVLFLTIGAVSPPAQPKYVAEVGMHVQTIAQVKPLPAVEAAPAVVELETVQVEAPVSAPAPAAAVTVSGCGDNEYAHFIYMHESGCNTSAVNPGGCFGIGQDCNGVVQTTCGADYACQNDYFSRYALSRYGSWANAAAVWSNQGWW